MFWRKKKGPPAPPQVGCFGKLPATGDFIRLNASTDELAAFDRWLGPSIDLARRSMGPLRTVLSAGRRALHLPRRRQGRRAAVARPRRCLGGERRQRRPPLPDDGLRLVRLRAALRRRCRAADRALAALHAGLRDRDAGPVSAGRRVPRSCLAHPPPSLDDPAAASAGYRAWIGDAIDASALGYRFGTQAEPLLGAPEHRRLRSSPSAGRSCRRRGFVCACRSAPATPTRRAFGWT